MLTELWLNLNLFSSPFPEWPLLNSWLCYSTTQKVLNNFKSMTLSWHSRPHKSVPKLFSNSNIFQMFCGGHILAFLLTLSLLRDHFCFISVFQSLPHSVPCSEVLFSIVEIQSPPQPVLVSISHLTHLVSYRASYHCYSDDYYFPCVSKYLGKNNNLKGTGYELFS
jgi:hypothetical protein